MNKQINTEKAPAAIGPYSQAVEANGMVFASGQLPIDPTTGAFAEGGVKEQTRQSLTNAKHILEEAGTDLQHVVKTTVFLSDMADFAAMNEVYAEFFSQPFPLFFNPAKSLGVVIVRAGQLIAQGQQNFGQGTHAGAADADKVDALDFL